MSDDSFSSDDPDGDAPTQAESAPDPVAAPLPLPRGIGPYRLVEELGRGGMGAVYLAERADGQFEQRVAIKLMRAGLDSPAARQAFAEERRILGRLQHPRIARMLDGGVSEEGRPYLVMELVHGVPITRYCDERRLTIGARLRMLVQVANAVAYAHRGLVVHRDLKPSNILVTPEGEVKLLDFGVAKLLAADDDEGSRAADTEPGLRALTPEYAAPEQARGEPITTATDTYGLGLLLYELLAGRRAYRLENRSLDELERVIEKRDAPLAPSAAVLDSGPPGAEEIAAARASTPARLVRRLRGDLDTICLMALRREPSRRYPTAAQLVEDVERHLTRRPVVARGDSLPYRLGRAFARHHLALGIGAAFAALLVGFAAVSALQSARIARERDKAQQVSRLLVELFEIADPEGERGETITAGRSSTRASSASTRASRASRSCALRCWR